MSINLGTPIKTKLNPKLYAITPEIAAQLLRNTDANPRTATPWSEAVLFRYGHEVAVTEVCDEFFGTWELAYDGDSFTIELTR